jgi:AraC family transcriptional regulator, positive regulator of tynA and feaB
VAVGVSARYLRDVFQDSGRTVSETLLKLRLEKRHKDLADPQLAPYSIKAIAFRNGFKNQSHFACAFKAEYSHTPTQARELAWAGANLRLSIDRSDPCVPSNA